MMRKTKRVSTGASIFLTYFRLRLSHTIYSACDSWILWPDMVSFRSRQFTQMRCCLKQWILKSKVHRRTALDTAEKSPNIKTSYRSSLLSTRLAVGVDQSFHKPGVAQNTAPPTAPTCQSNDAIPQAHQSGDFTGPTTQGCICTVIKLQRQMKIIQLCRNILFNALNQMLTCK